MAFRARKLFGTFEKRVENGKRETANVKNGGKLTTSWDFAVNVLLCIMSCRTSTVNCIRRVYVYSVHLLNFPFARIKLVTIAASPLGDPCHLMCNIRLKILNVFNPCTTLEACLEVNQLNKISKV